MIVLIVLLFQLPVVQILELIEHFQFMFSPEIPLFCKKNYLFTSDFYQFNTFI